MFPLLSSDTQHCLKDPLSSGSPHLLRCKNSSQSGPRSHCSTFCACDCMPACTFCHPQFFNLPGRIPLLQPVCACCASAQTLQSLLGIGRTNHEIMLQRWRCYKSCLSPKPQHGSHNQQQWRLQDLAAESTQARPQCTLAVPVCWQLQR